MATANPHAVTRRHWPIAFAVGVIVAVILAALFWRPLKGYAAVGTAYGAHVACSCRHAGGRSLEDCKKDFEPGMKLVSLSEDRARKSVTASFPLLKSTTATYREGWGCLLEPVKR